MEEEEEIEEESGFMPEPRESDYPVYRMTWADTRLLIGKLGLTAMMEGDDPDRHFFYTDEETWRKIIPYLTYPGEYYAWEERRDCDDYSKKASADSSFYYGLNCLQVWGNTPLGFHAFNMVLVLPDKWKLFEPNASFECAGELLDLKNEYGWEPVKWKP